MPAGLTETDTMVFAGATPWHGLGVQINKGMNFDDIFKLSGLDWEVATRPLYSNIGTTEKPNFISLGKHGQEAYRVDTGDTLGIVGPRWTPLQNSEAFNVFRPLVDKGDLEINTAGSLHGGKRVWVLCQINAKNQEIAKGDEICPFSLLSMGHDGKLAVHFGFTPIRVVCANTERMARESEASRLIKVRHNANVLENVESLRDIMDLAKGEFETAAETYRYLCSRAISKADLEKYVRVVMLKPEQLKEGAEIKTRTKNILSRVEELFETGKGNTLPGVEGTWWAAYNGITEYLNHERGRNNENRMDAVWFGQGGTLSQKALDQALALSA